ncbi:MAG TPA: hypothetical protein VF647_25780 [Longimicrobium sp.]|jgi:hypothetical protein
MRVFHLATFAATCLSAAACDPTYCSEVYGTVRTAAGQPAPDSTKIMFYIGPPPPDTASFAHVLDSTYTRAGGEYEKDFRLFIMSLSSIGIRTLGTDTLARIRSSTRCGRPPRTRVDLVGAPGR